ncbi:MAG: biopolymer transporter ExbD [Bacteroidetes bacterium]|nr:biopolymer transporter ExbD [Bacteroidota bacterium]
MGRAKLPRKSTNIDMTAMCDVAFLLLSFFILATKFKPTEALQVETPNSVSTKVAPEKDVVMITIDKAGKVYLSVSDANTAQKQDILDQINTDKNLGLTKAEIQGFAKNATGYIGVPFSQLKSFLDKTPDELKNANLSGIPVLDSTNNELIEWMHAAASAFQGMRMNILLKGDDASKYPSFKGVIDAFKKNDQMKFQMITNPVAVPAGTDLYKTNMTLGTKEVSS